METVVEAQWWFFWMGTVFGFFICASLLYCLLPSLRLHGVMVRLVGLPIGRSRPFTRAVCGLGRSSSPDAFHGRNWRHRVTPP